MLSINKSLILTTKLLIASPQLNCRLNKQFLYIGTSFIRQGPRAGHPNPGIPSWSHHWRDMMTKQTVNTDTTYQYTVNKYNYLTLNT